MASHTLGVTEVFTIQNPSDPILSLQMFGVVVYEAHFAVGSFVHVFPFDPLQLIEYARQLYVVLLLIVEHPANGPHVPFAFSTAVHPHPIVDAHYY
jgi:hypothetical protein